MRRHGYLSRGTGLTLAFGLVILAAFLLDGPVASALLPHKSQIKRIEVIEELREFGDAWVTALLAILLAVLHRDRLAAAALLVGNALLVGILRGGVALLIGRSRPTVGHGPWEFRALHPEATGWLNAQHLSFPSGHTALAFATALTLGHLLPRGKWLFYLAAGLVGAERVAESVHWTSDVVAGAGLGLLAGAIGVGLYKRLRGGEMGVIGPEITPDSHVQPRPFPR